MSVHFPVWAPDSSPDSSEKKASSNDPSAGTSLITVGFLAGSSSPVGFYTSRSNPEVIVRLSYLKLPKPSNTWHRVTTKKCTCVEQQSYIDKCSDEKAKARMSSPVSRNTERARCVLNTTHNVKPQTCVYHHWPFGLDDLKHQNLKHIFIWMPLIPSAGIKGFFLTTFQRDQLVGFDSSRLLVVVATTLLPIS